MVIDEVLVLVTVLVTVLVGVVLIQPSKVPLAYERIAALTRLAVVVQLVSIRCVSNKHDTVPAVPCGPVNLSIPRFIAAAALVHALAPSPTARMLSPRSTTHSTVVASESHDVSSLFNQSTSLSQSVCVPNPSTLTPYLEKH